MLNYERILVEKEKILPLENLRKPDDQIMTLTQAEISKDLHERSFYFFLSNILTISVPLNVWFEALDIRIDDNCAAQTHCFTFSPKGYIKLVDKADFKPGSIAMRGNGNCTREKKTLFFSPSVTRVGRRSTQ